MSIIKDMAKNAKLDSYSVASLSIEARNTALREMALALDKNKEQIFDANLEDMKVAAADNLPDPILKRLKFGEEKLRDVISGIESLTGLKDPLGRILLNRQLDEGLNLVQTTCPIGVIGLIFESRPDALVQIASLCMKSGNCAILKGGSESLRTNKALFEIIHKAGVKSGMPSGFLTLVESRSEIAELFKCEAYIDLLVPRGSNEFVRYIMDNSKIPVMGHADGICHIYVDKTADLVKAIPIILDAKTQYVAACNTVETLLINETIAPTLLPVLSEAVGKWSKPIEIRGCNKTKSLINCKEASPLDFHTEHLDYIMSVKIVSDLDEAISHINSFGSHHTDCIITEDKDNAEKFMNLVDSAGVYQNCSTRFADGFRYGFGAEVGISTGKLHARGPVGLDGLVTYKYKLTGNGQIVADYASGKSHFAFKDK